MRISKWTDLVPFHLEIKMIYRQYIDVLETKLVPILIAPPIRISIEDGRNRNVIQHKLSIKRYAPPQIHASIKTQQHVVRTSQGALYGPVQNDGVEILQFKLIVFPVENDGFKQTQ